MHPIPGIPDFLRISADDRKAAWKGHRFTTQGAGFRHIDAAEERMRSKLQREYDLQQAAKRRARLNAFLESRR